MPAMKSHTSFIRDESGAGTAWWILWMVIFLIFGGLAVDSSNAWRMRAELQATADASAHAGVIDLPNVNAAASAADGMATTNMPFSEHGDVLSNAEIEFGTWDLTNSIFVKDTGGVSPDSIRVTTRRDATNANRLQTYFLRLIGMSSWNVNAKAVAQRYWPECLHKDALIARHIVDLQSNNKFKKGLCVHGNDHVEVNNNNCWEDGVMVTMPKLADFVAQPNGWESEPNEVCDNSRTDGKNPGLADALAEEWFDPKIVDQIGGIVASMKLGESDDLPDYIGIDSNGDPINDDALVVTITSAKFDAKTAETGYIYHVTCPGNSLLVLGSTDLEISDMVIIADCRIYTGQGAYLHNVILASTAGDAEDNQIYPKAINIGQNSQLGVDDGCATTGNAKLFATGGSIRSAANVQAYGLQAVAVQDISLTAQAEGLEGILLQAGNDVSITSNNAFGGGCSGGVNPVEVPYFRLVL